jgi:hypothetical protein
MTGIMCRCEEVRYERVKKLAQKFANSEKIDVQTYKINNRFNFEPVNNNRENIIEIIKWVQE